jgi:hypothetical protein
MVHLSFYVVTYFSILDFTLKKRPLQIAREDRQPMSQNDLFFRNISRLYPSKKLKGDDDMRKLAVLFIMAALVLAGCQTSPHAGSGGREPVGGGKRMGSEKPSANQTLPDHAGDPSKVQTEARQAADLQPLYAKIPPEYGIQTGKYFGSGWAEWVTAISSGVRRPGGTAEINMRKLPPGTSVRFRFSGVDANMRRMEPPAEKIVTEAEASPSSLSIHWALSDKEDAYYLVSAEIIDMSGVTEDTLMELFYVPVQQLNAKLSVDPVQPGDAKAILKLSNAGPATLMTGADFAVEHKIGDVWNAVPLDLVFPAIGVRVKPGEEHKDEVSLTELPPGQYRLVKVFGAEGTKLTATLAAEITIPEK